MDLVIRIIAMFSPTPDVSRHDAPERNSVCPEPISLTIVLIASDEDLGILRAGSRVSPQLGWKYNDKRAVAAAYRH